MNIKNKGINPLSRQVGTSPITGRLKMGFTLVELLVVITIMGILTVVSLATFKNAQIKARDAQRKSDLEQVSKALMLYYSDTGLFPVYSAVPTNGMLTFGDDSKGFLSVNGNTIYMRENPQDPKYPNATYVYKTDGKSFNLFTNLENTKDSQCQLVNGVGKYTVGGVKYCYGISSPNDVVKNW